MKKMTKKNKTETVNADVIKAGEKPSYIDIVQENYALAHDNYMLKEHIKKLEEKIEKLGKLNEQAFIHTMELSKEVTYYQQLTKIERI